MGYTFFHICLLRQLNFDLSLSRCVLRFFPRSKKNQERKREWKMDKQELLTERTEKKQKVKLIIDILL